MGRRLRVAGASASGKPRDRRYSRQGFLERAVSWPEVMSDRSDLTALLSESQWLNALARRLCADADGADDLVQDTWVAALEHPPEGGRPLRGWLATVLRSKLGNRARSESRRSA